MGMEYRERVLRRVSALAAVAFCLAATDASATRIEYAFEAVIDVVSDDAGILDGTGIELGISIVGTMHWHTKIPDENPDPVRGLYLAPPGSDLIGLSISIVGEQIDLDSQKEIDLSIANDLDNLDGSPLEPFDRFWIQGNGVQTTFPSGLGMIRVVGMDMRLLSENLKALSDDKLVEQLNLSRWDEPELDILLTRLGDVALVTGTVRSLTLVPEPSSAVLCGLGLVTLALRRRWRA